MKSKFLRNLLPLLFFTMISATESFGFSISPMYLDMTTTGTKARATITVSNSSPKPMPVKTNISELTLNSNGKTTSSINKTDFVIFPPQAILPPHGRQTFRIQWRNQPRLEKGKTYELTVAQVLAKDSRPQEVKSGKSSISLQVALAFGSIINMRASSGSAKPAVTASKLSKDKQGKYVLETIITNSGNQNFLLAEAESAVTILGTGNRKLWSARYSPNEMLTGFGLGLVQPNSSRRMKIPLRKLPEHIARQAKSAKLEIRPSAK